MSESKLKNKYVIGSTEKPTLEECLNDQDCMSHIWRSCSSFRKMLNEDEVNDLSIDIINYAIDKYNGKSNFLTFIYLISRQKVQKYVTKRNKLKVHLTDKIETHKKMVTIPDSIIDEYVSDDLIDLARDKYVGRYTNTELMKKYNMSQFTLNKNIRKIKESVIDSIGV